MKHFLCLWCFHISHWPNELCHLGDDKCEEIAWEVNYNVFVISSNTRCTGTKYLQLHATYSLSSFKAGKHSRWWSFTLHLMHLWAQLQRQSPFGICASKSGSCWMNLSSCWPTAFWLQLLLRQYQLIVNCCNLISCNGAIVLRTCWCVTLMVAIMINVIVKWDWHLDAFNGLTTLIVALGVTLSICSCMTRMTKISSSTSLVPAVLRTFRHQLCMDCDITAAFLPHQGQPLEWGLIVVMTLTYLFHVSASVETWIFYNIVQFLYYAYVGICSHHPHIALDKPMDWLPWLHWLPIGCARLPWWMFRIGLMTSIWRDVALMLLLAPGLPNQSHMLSALSSLCHRGPVALRLSNRQSPTFPPLLPHPGAPRT